MSKPCVEIDFFEMERRKNAASKPSSPECAPSSFRALLRIQNLVSRINPQLLKTAMSAGNKARSSDNTTSAWAPAPSSNPPSPRQPAALSPCPLPVYNTASTCSFVCPPAGTAPLSIVYDGTVTIFDVPRDKALAIMRIAEMGLDGKQPERAEDSVLDGNQVAGGLPMARRKSLLRFFEKRKERLASVSPYQYQHSKLLVPSRPCL